jgi:diaminohydroxyphosphoribosylaminopyrimidine deaminase/5-amino-6-(5-phosphoribosylamino)uracil reductase
LRIPEQAKVVEHSPSKTIIATTEAAPREKIGRLRERGVGILISDSKEGRVDLKDCLSRLGEMGFMSLLVEGGSQVNGDFLDGKLFDKLLLFLSPKLIGDPQAIGIFGGKGFKHLSDAISLSKIRTKRIGEDILIEGYRAK